MVLDSRSICWAPGLICPDAIHMVLDHAPRLVPILSGHAPCPAKAFFSGLWLHRACCPIRHPGPSTNACRPLHQILCASTGAIHQAEFVPCSCHKIKGIQTSRYSWNAQSPRPARGGRRQIKAGCSRVMGPHPPSSPLPPRLGIIRDISTPPVDSFAIADKGSAQLMRSRQFATIHYPFPDSCCLGPSRVARARPRRRSRGAPLLAALPFLDPAGFRRPCTAHWAPAHRRLLECGASVAPIFQVHMIAGNVCAAVLTC